MRFSHAFATTSNESLEIINYCWGKAIPSCPFMRFHVPILSFCLQNVLTLTSMKTPSVYSWLPTFTDIPLYAVYNSLLTPSLPAEICFSYWALRIERWNNSRWCCLLSSFVSFFWGKFLESSPSEAIIHKGIPCEQYVSIACCVCVYTFNSHVFLVLFFYF